MSNYAERNVGDVVISPTGSLVLLVSIDNYDFRNPSAPSYDLGMELQPAIKQVKLILTEKYRRVCSIGQLLQLASEHGIDTKTLPERELSELEILKQRLAALEAK